MLAELQNSLSGDVVMGLGGGGRQHSLRRDDAEGR